MLPKEILSLMILMLIWRVVAMLYLYIAIICKIIIYLFLIGQVVMTTTKYLQQ